jgi:hypothetical protein
MEISVFVQEMGGVVSSPALAEALGIDPNLVRLWARENGVPMLGNSFAFTADMAAAFLADVLDEDDDDDDGGDDEEEDEDDPDADELLDSLDDDDDEEEDDEDDDDDDD